MRLSDLEYNLPKELIAAYPPEDRTSAKLLCADRRTGKFEHRIFRDVAEILQPGDVLVLNNTKVIPARIFAEKKTGGKVEILLLEEQKENTWKALVKPGKRVRAGMILNVEAAPCGRPSSGRHGGLPLQAEVLNNAQQDSGERLVRFSGENIRETLKQIGHIPLPPYIDRPDSEIDRELYQTVFAEKEGAVASPTAGLHFNEALLDELRKKGIEIVFVTLHVSYGTFQPIGVEDLTQHKMYEETFEVSQDAADKINKAKREGRKIFACGTTTVRTLESAVNPAGEVEARSGKTNLFIYPPYSFKIVQGMITNFHLPKSSLLCLVAAFLDCRGRPACLPSSGEHIGSPLQFLFKIYDEAIRSQYRFYSYGDAMLIL